MPPRTRPTYDELMKRSVGADPVLCWEWKGAFNCDGTPVYGGTANGREKYVARRVWLAANRRRTVPKGKNVRHSCGNRSCVNPEHLELVDNGDNLRDVHAARRIRQGHFSRSST